MDYFVVFYISNGLSSADKVNAQGKARDDVRRTLLSVGATEIAVTRRVLRNPLKKGKTIPYISGFFQAISEFCLSKKVKSGDRVFFQDFTSDLHQYMIKQCKKRGAEVHIIVHDILSVRFRNYAISKDVDSLNNADFVYIHTESFKKLLVENGLTAQTKVLQIFDYYSDDPLQEEIVMRNMKNDVVFAGNLEKSEFLKPWIGSGTRHTCVHLYGLKSNLVIHGNFKYEGAFNSSNTSFVKGGWGLVWDGDSHKTCSGPLGEYLKYNSSHKISLYIACGIPLIVWKESSLAEWVTDNKLGITISSLEEIDNSIDSVSISDYMNIVGNVRCLSIKVRSGYFLKNLLK